MMIKTTFGVVLLTCGTLAAEWLPVQFDSMDYPLLAAQAGIEGTVRLKLRLTADGRVERADLISGNAILGQAAEINALSWKFIDLCASTSGPAAVAFN
jgi:TonB family protein